jgi:hypothetical protein
MAMIRRACALVIVGGFLGLPVASLLCPWRVADGGLVALGYVLFSLGALIAVSNFYLSFLRVPILRLRGRALSDIRHVSVIPVFGMLIVLGLALAPANRPLSIIALLLTLLDTGNILWFLLAVWNDHTFWAERTPGAG